MDEARIKVLFQFMDYDYLTDAQHDLVLSFDEFYRQTGYLSERQIEILEDIYKKASEA
jgi:hypothetical protein